MNKAAINICVQVRCEHKFSFLWDKAQDYNCLVPSYACFIYFLRNCQIVFLSGCIILHFPVIWSSDQKCLAPFKRLEVLFHFSFLFFILAILLNSLDIELQNVTFLFPLEKGAKNAILPYGTWIHPKCLQQILLPFKKLFPSMTCFLPA